MHPRLVELYKVFRAYPMSQIEIDRGCLFHNRINGLVTLCNYILDPSSVVLETGTLWGVSAEVFALHCKQLTTVDLYEPHPDIIENGVTIGASMLLKHSTIEQVRADTLQYAKQVTNKYDLVYLDTVHDEDFVTQEIQLWSQKVKPGGYIGGHDYCPFLEGVTAAVNKIFGRPDYTFSDSSWLKKL